MNKKEQSDAWMGPRGFDEARYYNDQASDLGIHRSDESIKLEAQEAISRNEELKNCKIEVVVKDGEIKLMGVVKDQHQINLARESVCFLTGVKSVINQLTFS